MTGVRAHANFSHSGLRTQRKRALTMSMCERTLILGVAIGIALAVTTTSASQAGMIGPGKLQITEPTSLVEPVRARMGSSVSAGSTVRSGGPTPGPGRIGGITVDPRALNLKAKQLPRGRYCHHGGCQK
jgi:hypothetical protein